MYPSPMDIAARASSLPHTSSLKASRRGKREVEAQKKSEQQKSTRLRQPMDVESVIKDQIKRHAYAASSLPLYKLMPAFSNGVESGESRCQSTCHGADQGLTKEQLQRDVRPSTGENFLRTIVQANQRMESRLRREWSELLVPNGLDWSIQVWSEAADGQLQRFPDQLETAPTPAEAAVSPHLHRVPSTFFSPNADAKLESSTLITVDNLSQVDLRRPGVIADENDCHIPDSCGQRDPSDKCFTVSDSVNLSPTGSDEHSNRAVRLRASFFKQLRFASAQRDLLRLNANEGIDDEALAMLPVDARTPRQEYLRAILETRQQEGTLPLPILLRRRESAPNALDLTGAGVGDTVIVALTRVIVSLAGLDTLLLKNNCLTDLSLIPLCTIACNLSALTALDLSGNDIDKSAHTLRAYLAQRDCKLRKLWLAKADIDDHECADFMCAVRNNRSLTTLSLSNNLIGDAESFNTLNPDFVTGGEAIGITLRDNYKLSDLDLSWNKIRKDSAIELGKALAHNGSLTKLNLAYNGFADEPTQYLGLALGENVMLRELDLSFNAIKATAAMVLSCCFHSNHTLTSLNLAGNPVGKRGGEALVTAVRRYQLPERFLMIKLANADLECDSADSGTGQRIFNPASPSGEYILDMETPYGQMVAKEMYRLASSSRAFSFKEVLYYPRSSLTSDEGTGSRGETFEFKRKRERRQAHVSQVMSAAGDTAKPWYVAASQFGALLATKGDPFPRDDPEVRHAIAHLLKSLRAHPNDECVCGVLSHFRRTNTSKGVDGVLFSIFMALFDSIDTNRSGTIDVREMCRGLSLLGVDDGSIELATRIVTTYDIEGTNQIERNEFVHWAMGALLGRKLDKLDTLLDARTHSRWTPPTKGTLCVKFVGEPRLPTIELRGSNIGNDGLIRNIQAAASDIDRGRLFDKAVTNTDIYFSIAQATEIIDKCNVGMNQLDMMSKLLPVMSSHDEACALVETCLSLSDRIKLREKMGALFDACTTNPTGFYALDLREELDRKAAFKLAEVNCYQVAVARGASSKDTSQKGDWQNFRNEFLNDIPLSLSSRWFVDMPPSGKLRFDFVSTRRPNRSARPLSVRRFVQLCQRLQLSELAAVDDFYQSITQEAQRRNSFYLAAAHRPSNLVSGSTPTAPAAAPTDDEDDCFNEVRSVSSLFTVSDDEDDFEDDSSVASQNWPSQAQREPLAPCLGHVRGVLGNQLGVLLPQWILRRNVVDRWRLLKLSTHLKSDWLGLEKARDTAKLLGIDDQHRVANLTAEREVATGEQQQLANTSATRKASAALELTSTMTKKTRNSSSTGKGLGGKVIVKPNETSTLNSNEDDEQLLTQSHAQIDTSHPSDFIAEKQAGSGVIHSDQTESGGPLEASEQCDTDNEDQSAEFSLFEFVPSKFSRFDAKTFPCRAYAIVYYKLALLRVATMSVWLTVKQILYIMKQFPVDDFTRVFVAVILHARCYDIDNYHTIFTHLEPPEQVELLHRLGWLNTHNPMQPDRIYVLDLRW